MKTSIRELNNQNGVVQNLYLYETVIRNKQDWANDSYHFGHGQVKRIIDVIRYKTHKNSIFK